MLEHISYQNLAIAVAGMFGGIVDASVGGGGFIMLSMMMTLGIPAHLSLGANKVVIMIGSLFAIYRFGKMNMIEWRIWHLKSYVIIIIASIFGSIVISISPSNLIHKISPIIMCLLLLYQLYHVLYENSNTRDQRISTSSFIWIFCTLVGFYAGLFGPGVTTIWIIAMCALLGKDSLWAVSNCKLFALVGCIPTVIIFLIQGLVPYYVTSFLIAGYLVGTEIGILLTVRCGIKFVNMLLIIMLTTLTIMLTQKYYF